MLLTALVIGLIAYVCLVLVDKSGAPHPFGMIAKVIIVVIAIYAILVKTGLASGLGL
jgi:hypothetical protein